MQKPLGVILAGGQARRMGGGDKGLLTLGGIDLLSRIIGRLAPQVAQIAINANGDPARFSSFGLPVIADGVPDFAGPLAGVLAGLDWASQNGATHIISVAADTPFFPTDLTTQLVNAANSENALIALAASPHSERGLLRQPTFGLWPVELRNDLRHSLSQGVRKIVVWTDTHATAIAQVDAVPFDPFFNVNTPADLAIAENMILEYHL